MSNLETFFTDAFENLTEKEEFYKAVFMNMNGAEAARLRSEYYRSKFKSCGKNFNIGVGVRISHPECISVGDNVSICDDVTIVARGGTSEINIGNDVNIMQRVYLDTEHDDSVMNIVNEEIEYFFNGERTAEQTAEYIQSRVNLYVNEQR